VSWKTDGSDCGGPGIWVWYKERGPSQGGYLGHDGNEGVERHALLLGVRGNVVPVCGNVPVILAVGEGGGAEGAISDCLPTGL